MSTEIQWKHDLEYEDFIKAVRSASEYAEKPIKEWLMKNLGDKYSDDINTIIVFGIDHKNEVIGKYNICTSSYIEKNRIIAYNRDFIPLQTMPYIPEPSGLIAWVTSPKS
ncbi:hypothetical protein [Sulfuricurvum sp.]|uniref:hypothetical protein n=1 Tax=Sulfuricurvum sp. TaxID=2025608 RepID=UPI002628A5CA|nr:hypothetical protein [Sulfuricurvum sp.]MDD2267639.1 hypothetical protein [Sulfuricurvum sp.]MDD2784969.1 hypothetical protein [Sulfuricurvum sp.]